MGLDISAIRGPMVLINTQTEEERESLIDEDDVVHVYSAGFPERLGSLVEDGYYRTGGREDSFRAGSYGGYNDWRDWLSRCALGVGAREVWNNRDAFKGRPFYDIVDFSDCEGVIGPEVCKKLADDFAKHREDIAAKTARDAYYMVTYDEFAAAFKLAAETGGCVQFH